MSSGRPARTVGTVCPPMPLPASTTTFSGRIADRSTRECRYVGVAGERVPGGDGARSAGRRRGAVVRPPFDQGADLGEARVLADRFGAGAAQLDAVVPGRVVRGGEHRAGQAEGAGGVVQLVRRAEADLGDVGALRGRAAGEGAGQAGGRGTHVMAGHDRVRAGDLDERGAEELGRRLVPLVGDHAAHVVRLDESGQVGAVRRVSRACHRCRFRRDGRGRSGRGATARCRAATCRRRTVRCRAPVGRADRVRRGAGARRPG